MKKILFSLLLLLFAWFVPTAYAQNNSFVTIVNPIRGNEFWSLKDQQPQTAISEQVLILDKFNLPASWLFRYDALENNNIVSLLKSRSSDEKGLFLEITPGWANQAGVKYRNFSSWHAAGSAFLTGYETSEREKLIEAAFEKFKSVFGYYPVSVGAWWIDSYSIGYMQKKYNITSVLIVADQYSTDNYQIWGQYFSTPYYPVKHNALHPAQSTENKLNVVMMQWAPRDPVNSYGNGVSESTFSVQANDYIDYHNLDTKYFTRLIDIYTGQKLNQFAQIVVGLENSYEWSKYGNEYKNQIEILSQKKNSNQIVVVTMNTFADWYKSSFPKISPTQLIVADDPLGSFKKAVWFMNPYYRAALFVNQDGVVFRDIRQYIESEEELCFLTSCSSVNFATFATRVLDEVTYGHKWVIDPGKIKDFKVFKQEDSYVITYTNEAGNKRTIEFMLRDIKVDDKVSTIDGAILNAVKQDKKVPLKSQENNWSFNWSILSIFPKFILFVLFLIIGCVIPGLVLTKNFYEKSDSFWHKLFLSTIIGLTFLTIFFYITSLLHVRFISFFYLVIFMLLFFRFKLLASLKFGLKRIDKLSIIPILVVISGTIFQVIPTFRSGLLFFSGMGFWGPNTHDGVWHVSLINELLKGLPVTNPIFASTNLKNYHFFYDLLITATTYLTKLSILDLVFRFYPIIFSLLLGIGTYYFVVRLFEDKIGALQAKVAAIFSLYFVYFAGSFGWIVEYIKQKTLGGESAFWVNQSISFNLNPPFAVSLLIIIAFLHIFISTKKNSSGGIIVSGMLIGSLAGFKSYAAVLVISSLIPLAVIYAVKRKPDLLYITVFSAFFSLIIFLSNFSLESQLISFAPFWFIHSMVDSPSRVGWDWLSIARVAGVQTNDYFKYISAEIIGLFLFIVGNLGLRILSFGSLIKIKKILADYRLLFLLIFSTVSITIPVLFIQAGNPWNVIQFSYYSLYTTAIASGVVLSWLIFRLQKIFLVGVLFGVLILTPVNSITTATYYLGFPHALINNQEIEALVFLSKQAEGVVLTYPYDEKIKQKLAEPRPMFAYDSTAYVSALSRKSVFFEDESQNQILLTDYRKRLVASRDFFLNNNSSKKLFLADNKIKYIYIPKIFNIDLDEQLLSVKNIFENSEVVIYKVI